MSKRDELVALYSERMAEHGNAARASFECLNELWQREHGFSEEVASHIALGDFEGALHALVRQRPLEEGEWIALLVTAQDILRRSR